MRGVWTGAELIIVAGSTGGAPVTGNGELALSDGAAYDPVTGTWRAITSGPAHPGFVPLWTGSQMIMIAKGARSCTTSPPTGGSTRAASATPVPAAWARPCGRGRQCC